MKILLDMANFHKYRYIFILGFISVIILILFIFNIFLRITPKIKYYPTPDFHQLNIGIEKAEKYYDGLYHPLNNSTAVMVEYYSTNKSVYTVRHGVIGGYYYYKYIENTEKMQNLLNFIKKYNFIPFFDDHSFIWTTKNNAPLGIVYDTQDYHDCFVTLPFTKTISPYHSKVCKLGSLGMNLYFLFSRFDTLSPLETDLQALQQGKHVESSYYEYLFNKLGYGIPICTPLGCGKVASTIRTAQFGVLEMRLGHMKYADAVAYSLLKAQNKEGAIYVSFNKNGELVDEKSIAYKIINFFLNDKSSSKEYIPTNAETMNDVLAFLLQYQQARYNTCLAYSSIYEK